MLVELCELVGADKGSPWVVINTRLRGLRLLTVCVFSYRCFFVVLYVRVIAFHRQF